MSATMPTHRDIAWEWRDRAGLEHLTLAADGTEIRAEGLVVLALDGSAVRLHHTTVHDARWRFREAHLAMERGAERREVRIVRAENGAWTIDGVARPDLAGCTGIDIMATPFTNTPAIREEPLPPDGSRILHVAFVRLPDLAVAPVEQEYTRLDPASPPHLFRYTNRKSGFTAELTVDDDGIVVDYPGYWRLRGGGR